MNRDKIGTQTYYVHPQTFVSTLMYIACLSPNLVSVHFYAIGTQTGYIHQCTNESMLMYIACLCPNLVSYAIPILHSKFPKFFIYLYQRESVDSLFRDGRTVDSLLEHCFIKL